MTGRGIKSMFKFSAITAPKAAYKALIQTPFRIIRGVTDLPGRAMSEPQNYQIFSGRV